MKAVQSNALAMYKRVLSFLTKYTSQLGTIPQLTAVATLTSLVATLTGSGATQGSSVTTKSGNALQLKALRATLINTMRSIAAMADEARKTVNNIPTVSAPPLNVTDGKLLLDANAFVAALTPFDQTLVSTSGLADGFLADLSSEIAQFDSTVTIQGMIKGERVNATTTVATGLQSARTQLKIIKPRVVNALAGNEPALSEWKNIIRISPQPSSSSTASTPVTPTPTPTPTPTDHLDHPDHPEAKAA